MFVLAASAGVLATACYWLWRRRASPAGLDAAGSPLLPVVLAAAVALLLLAGRAGPATDGNGGTPLFIVLAVDLSLSMGAAPEPTPEAEAATRMERVREPLLEIVRMLESASARVMVSITGFTVESQPILVWDDHLPQVREVVEHVLVPGLLTRPGSDLGTGVAGALRLFDNLPAAYDGAGSERLLILVSDGEQAMAGSDLATRLEELRGSGIRVVALHVGSLGVPEGLHQYNDEGVFSGFVNVGGELHTVPDPETMSLIAGGDSAAGQLVEVDRADAAAELGRFIGIDRARSTTDHLQLGLALTLVSFAVMLLAWFC